MLHDYSHGLCTPGAIFYMSVMLASLSFFFPRSLILALRHTHTRTHRHTDSLSLLCLPQHWMYNLLSAPKSRNPDSYLISLQAFPLQSK